MLYGVGRPRRNAFPILRLASRNGALLLYIREVKGEIETTVLLLDSGSSLHGRRDGRSTNGLELELVDHIMDPSVFRRIGGGRGEVFASRGYPAGFPVPRS